MTLLSVPPLEEEPWPTLGPQITEFIEEYLVFGPGDLRGQPAVVDDEWGALIDRMYEVYPRAPGRAVVTDQRNRKRHASPRPDQPDPQLAGRRRFKRCGISLRKGTAKTEKAAWLAACELHPDAPVRTVAWGFRGDPYCPEGSGVQDPYIPMIAYTEEQTEDLAYGALYVVLSLSPLVNDFDIGYERIMRVRGDGKAEARASSPDARDGARTTFQHFDETHRFVLARLKQTHQTMLRNIPKRYAADAWSLETTTAYVPGEDSVAEGSMEYARAVIAGSVPGKDFFFFHRQASDKWDLSKPRSLRSAIIEAAPLAAEWSDINAIAGQWDDPQFDPAYGEQVWLNRPTQHSRMAFDVESWKLHVEQRVIERGALIVLGFDGSRVDDSTAIIATHVESGYQWPIRIWEKTGPNWQVPEEEVDAVMAEAFDEWQVWRLYADPRWWEGRLAIWAGRWGERVVKWDTATRHRNIAYAVQSYAGAIARGEVTNNGDPVFASHIGNAHRRDTQFFDAEQKRLYAIQKERSDSPHKMDAAMAGCLSWQARTDAIAAGVSAEEPAWVAV